LHDDRFVDEARNQIKKDREVRGLSPLFQNDNFVYSLAQQKQLSQKQQNPAFFVLVWTAG
jgi:hypothetical protein